MKTKASKTEEIRKLRERGAMVTRPKSKAAPKKTPAVEVEQPSAAPAIKAKETLAPAVKPTKKPVQAKAAKPAEKTKKPRKEPKGIPENFSRKFHGESYTIHQNGNGWTVNGKHVGSSHDAMVYILTKHDVSLEKRSASTFFRKDSIEKAEPAGK